ncbi:MAG TPA: hypothetical protein DCZ94_20605 [Lentisphaeria bacterium]|nr:MAG: hypothetical protein A2X48_16450 [Lentisphaerae bacterium GWF2_49_21]HBC89348.1 hypothetical protein [Lentisphaeria bacterium]
MMGGGIYSGPSDDSVLGEPVLFYTVMLDSCYTFGYLSVDMKMKIRNPISKNHGFVLVLLAGLILFVPWCPIIATFYYEYCIHLATCEGWQFGTDIISTYGPFGFVGLPFYRASTYPSMILLNICLYGIMVAFLWEFWQNIVNPARPSAVWIVIILLLPGFGPAMEWSPVLFTPYVLVNLFVLRHFFGKTAPSYLYLFMFVIVLGMFVLVKGTFIFLILMTIVVVSADQIINSKKVPWIFPGFIVGVLVLWVVSSQKTGNILGYFLSTADLIAGYKDGAGSFEGTKLGIAPVVFALGSLGLIGTFLLTVRKLLGWRSIWPASILAATLYVMFQHGFVRQDPQHSVSACLSFCCLYVLMLPLLWVLSGGNKTLRRVLVANGTVGIIIIATCWLSGGGRPVVNSFFQRIKGIPALMTQGVSALETAREAHLQLLKQKFPLPQFDGSMESSTFDAGVAEAYGNYSMVRPTVTLYVAYTSKMSMRNKDYLEDASGPGAILFSIPVAIDGRYPAATDSIGLLAQKTHFSAIGRVGNLLVLERRARPLKLKSEKLQELDVDVNGTISLPDPGKGMVFAQIEITPTIAGRLFSLLYKPAATFIIVSVGTEEARFRLIRATAKEGMLLSPLLCDLPSFQAFYSDSNSSLKLSGFRIEYEKGREWCYQNKIKVVLSKVNVD